MTDATARRTPTRVPALDADGAAAPPRSNGELVFAEPWESRAFAMAVALADAGAFGWNEFRGHLVARIAAREHEDGWSYYRCWLEALESLLVRTGRLADGAVTARGHALVHRPPGHDHPVARSAAG